MYKNSLGGPEAAGGTWKSGGRPCPPAGIARIYGNPMRNRNILEGRCGHRPLQKTSQDFTILEGGQSRPPLQRVLDRTCGSGEKPPRCPFRAIGVDAYLGAKSRVLPVSRRRSRCPHRPTLQNGNTPARGRMGVIVQGFNFHPVGADDPVRPPELPGFMEIQCEIATF